MEPDLTSSITMHPRPYRLESYSSPSRSSMHTPAPAHGGTTATNASSTAVERHTPSSGTDIESQVSASGGLLQYTRGVDPYSLWLGYKTDTDLADIRANTSRKRVSAQTGSKDPGSSGGGGILGSYLPLPTAALRAKHMQGFYLSQNTAIERLLKSVEEHRAEARQEQGDHQIRYQIAVYGSFIANMVLAALQIYGAVASGSLSLFTTIADTIFDPLSNMTLIVTNRAVRRVDPSRFPSGKARLEMVGNIVFCFLMTAVSFILIAISASELSDRRNQGGTNDFHLPSVIAVAIAFVTKLALFLYTCG